MKDKDNFKNVVLIDEEGKELEFAIIDLFFVDEQEYAVLVPFKPEKAKGSNDDEAEYESEAGGSEEVVIMRIAEKDGEITLLDIDDEEERQKVADIVFEGQFEQEEE